jgi:hypothetical protein
MIAFIVGLFIGAGIGVLVMALFVISSEASRAEESAGLGNES